MNDPNKTDKYPILKSRLRNNRYQSISGGSFGPIKPATMSFARQPRLIGRRSMRASDTACARHVHARMSGFGKRGDTAHVAPDKQSTRPSQMILLICGARTRSFKGSFRLLASEIAFSIEIHVDCARCVIYYETRKKILIRFYVDRLGWEAGYASS